MDIRYSRHARERMVERGISDADIAEAILKGTKGLQNGSKILAAYRYYIVVYKKFGQTYYVITVTLR